MARDRLAAMRQQRGGEYETSSNSYPAQTNPYSARHDRGYEMQDVHGSDTNLVGGGVTGNFATDMSAFYGEVSSVQDTLRTFNDNVAQIGDLHSRSLDQTDEAAAARIHAQLDELIQDTSALSNELKKRIKALERTGGAGSRDAQIRRQQSALVKSKFVEAIQSYQQVEQQYRQKYKQRMERQFKIVRPDATPEEVRAAVDDVQGGQVFQQALMSSTRYGESKAAYREVQERHEDIKRIEQTITELAQLFNDMSILVEQQDEQIATIEATASDVEKDMESGITHMDKAVESAAGARRKRKICFIITIVLLIIIAIVVAIVVVKNLPKNNNGGGGTKTVTESAAASATATPARRYLRFEVQPTPIPAII